MTKIDDKADRTMYGGGWRQRLSGLTLFAVCAGLVWVGGFYLIAVLTHATLYLNDVAVDPAAQVKPNLIGGQPVNSEAPLAVLQNVDMLQRGFDASLKFWPDGRIMRQAAMLDYRMAIDLLATQNDIDRKRAIGHLSNAQAKWMRSTQVEPLNRYGWNSLAGLFTWTPGPSIGAAIQLERSYKAAPTDRLLWDTRTKIAWRNFRFLSDDAKALMAREQRVIWRLYDDAQVPYTRNRFALMQIAALAGRQADLKDMICDTDEDRALFEDIAMRLELRRRQQAREPDPKVTR